jgi:hypothetical protein
MSHVEMKLCNSPKIRNINSMATIQPLELNLMPNVLQREQFQGSNFAKCPYLI